VEETQSPYAPPKSDISIVPEKQGPGVKKVFSPAQGCLGALLGGALPGAYFVTMNFLALGARKRARLTIVVGSILVLSSLLWHNLLHPRLLYSSVRIVYPVAAWLVIGRSQFTKPQILSSRTLTFHSNWRVAGVVLVGLLINIALALVLSHFVSLR
jgi:hypothetical protein